MGKIALWSPYVRYKPANVTYGVPPKNGTSAFYEALRRAHSLPRTKHFKMIEQNPSIFEKVEYLDHPGFFIVRHPLDRFESLWRSKCRDRHGSIGGHPVRGMNPYELFEYIQTHDDIHWRRQVDMIRAGEDPKLVPIEEFSAHFLRHTGLEMWPINQTKSMPTDYFDLGLLSDVADYYSEDEELYERALANYSRI